MKDSILTRMDTSSRSRKTTYPASAALLALMMTALPAVVVNGTSTSATRITTFLQFVHTSEMNATNAWFHSLSKDRGPILHTRHRRPSKSSGRFLARPPQYFSPRASIMKMFLRKNGLALSLQGSRLRIFDTVLPARVVFRVGNRPQQHRQTR